MDTNEYVEQRKAATKSRMDTNENVEQRKAATNWRMDTNLLVVAWKNSSHELTNGHEFISSSMKK
jgi:hypothetical protein